MSLSSAPHATHIGCPEFSRIPIVVRSDGGQSEGSPSGVADQSYARMRTPISAPPARKGEVIEGALGSAGGALASADTNTPEP
jgi:hypothetical protein